MSEFDSDQAEAAEPKRPETKRVLNVSLEIGDADTVDVVSKVNDLGFKINSLAINNQYDYPLY